VPFTNKIYPNVYVSSLYLGEKNIDLAKEHFTKNFRVQDKLILNINGQKNTILVSEIVTGADVNKTVERAYNFTNSGNIFLDIITRTKLIFTSINLAPILMINNDKLTETILIASSSIDSKPINPSASEINGFVNINIGKNGVIVDIDKARSDIGSWLSYRKNNEIVLNLKVVNTTINNIESEKYKEKANKVLNKELILKQDDTEFILDDNTLLSFISPTGYYDDFIYAEILKISNKLNRNPQDSIFVIENQKVKEFAPSKDGVVVDEKELIKNIKNIIESILNNENSISEIVIPIVTTSPKIKNEDVNDFGIKTLIGTGFSNFKGSIPNRIHNVNLAQSKFRGVLIPPETIVSFNDILGDVSSYTGYKSAYVIMDGKTVLGDGGGVCQVSTTLFRAVLNAGLPVIDRRAHAYRVGYYEQGFGPGLDATVYSPTTDFKFKNDTSAYLLLQPTIDLDNLTLKFEIYGTDDGRISNLSKPIVASSIAPGNDVYIDDPTLPSGQIKQIEHRAYGAKVIFDYKVTRNGEELINQKFVSNYRPWTAVFLRGVAQ
jgi:vancomycin resistance protein YoaR